jgi:hypothetical protein
MCGKMIYLLFLALMLSLVLVGAAEAEMVGWWKLNEGSGTSANDSSGYGNHGTLRSNPQWVVGIAGGALEFSGTSDFVDCGSDESLNITGPITIALWMRPAAAGEGGPNAGPVCKAESGNTWSWQLRYNAPGGNFMGFQFAGVPEGSTWVDVQENLSPGEWYHIAGTFDGTNIKCHLNGAETDSGTISGIRGGESTFFIGQDGWVNVFSGAVDEVRIYNHALSEAEILGTMAGEVWPYAYGPDPEDGAMHHGTWVTLSWKPGGRAVSHDVYLGDDLDQVNACTGDTFRGNQITTFYVAGFPGLACPDGLVPGTMYYWRIDEVNEADPNSPWKGDVWTFSIPPKTAYDPDPADGIQVTDPNSVTLSWTAGFGAILHTVYFGDDFDDVNNAISGVPAGTTAYSPGPLELEKVYYWRVDEFDAKAMHKGDVWTFTTPGAVGNPQPANGATDVAMNAILSWAPATNAASHQLYFGTDKEAVRNADTGAPEYKGSIALDAERYDPGLLEADTAYFWRVDEVDGQANTSLGPLWIFTTGAFLLVDDFEGYTDDDPTGEVIWQTWIDGFGVADNGAQVGYLLPPYAEQTIVHGGSQSMPLLYTNEAGVTNSEASMTLAAVQDWTQAGVAELSLWFRGSSANAADPLYVAVSNSAGAPGIVVYDNASAVMQRSWTQWTIPLQAFDDQGIILTNVDKIAIGLGSKSDMAVVGGTGTMFIDDIALYRPEQ